MNLLSVPSLSSIAKDLSSSSQIMTNISLSICGAVLAIGLITTIFKLTFGSGGTKEALIGWFAGILVYLLAIETIINK